MLIACPYCGARDAQEFAYRGDATVKRPDPAAAEAVYEYVYLRDNPDGAHREYWYHAAGCRRWLEVERDTRTHAISAVGFAAEPR
jgi:sarcosine oxidase subunit delta